MTIRSDWTLELLLEKTRDESSSDTVQAAVQATLTYMHSAPNTPRRGGQKLIEHLRLALAAAQAAAESSSVHQIQDAIDYAENKARSQDIKETHKLFKENRRDNFNLQFIMQMASASVEFWTETGRKLLEKDPATTANQLLDHISTTAREIPFMDAPEDRPGRYRIVRGRAEAAAWAEEVLHDRIDVEDAHEAAGRIVTSPEALAVLAADADGQALIHAAEMLRRRTGLAELRTVVQDPTATETDIHRVLRRQLWIFGGRFVGEALRRRLVPGDEVDIPLLRPDGSLCIVELKRAMVPTVKYYRKAPVPTSDVNDAVSQAVNYLVGLDENRQEILDRFSIDTRRANAIVLIGHPLAQPEISESIQQETMRVHNAHRSRLEVLTYKVLLDSAERSLQPRAD